MSNKQSEAAVATTTTASDSKVSTVESTDSESTANVAVEPVTAKDNPTDTAVPVALDGAIVVESLQSAAPGATGAAAPAIVNGPIVSVTPNRFSKEVRFVSCDKIMPNPKNKVIYGDESDDKKSIKDVEKNGIYQPLLVIPDKQDADMYVLLAGHRRLKAALQLDFTEVPVVIFDSTDELEQDEALVKSNRNRVKTTSQLAQEAKFLMEVETKSAAVRMATKSATQGVKDVSQADQGKARDKVGKTIGVSGPTAEKMVEVAKAVESLEVEGKHDEAVELTQTLNKSVSGAHIAVKEKV